MTESNILRSRNETVSLGMLEQVLPNECFQAVCSSFQHEYPKVGNDIYNAYFNSIPELPLSEEEKEELFETLGSDLVKGHYSTQQLRSFLESNKTSKKRRNE